MKTPEEMAEEYLDQDKVACDAINHAAEYLVKDAFIAGYKAAQQQPATKKVTDDYIETASNEAKELIAKFELEGDQEMLVKALVAAYCRGVDAVDGYLRNSLSAYRASVKNQQWISVKERLPEEGFGWTMVYGCILSRWAVQPGFYDKDTSEWVSRFIGGDGDKEGYAPFESVTHWMPLPAPPKEEK